MKTKKRAIAKGLGVTKILHFTLMEPIQQKLEHINLLQNAVSEELPIKSPKPHQSYLR